MSEYARRRYREIAYGRWQPYVDAAPVRDHVRALMRGANGMSLDRIARLSGVSKSVLHDLLRGRPEKRGGAPSYRIRTHNAQRLLDLNRDDLTIEDLPDLAYVDALPTQAYIRVLVENGWAMGKIAEAVGISGSGLSQVMHRSRVYAVTARRVADLARTRAVPTPDEMPRGPRGIAARKRIAERQALKIQAARRQHYRALEREEAA